MPKKFKQAPVDSRPTGVLDLDIGLLDYIKSYAPEVLQVLPCMQHVSPLRFWQETFQASRPGEGKRMLNQHLRWPYAERLVYLAREFLKLDPRAQQYILKAAQAQIWWRGDPIPQFRAIVKAQYAYRNLSPAERASYRKQVLSTMRSLTVRPSNQYRAQ